MGVDVSGHEATMAAAPMAQLPISVRMLTLAEAATTGWDDYVNRHQQGTPYHRLAWLAAVEKAYGHTCKALVALTASGELTGVLPLCHISRPWGGNRLTSLPFCDLGGPLADDNASRKALLQSARDMATKSGSKTCEMRLAGPLLQVEQAAQGGTAAKVSMLCELPITSEALFQRFKPKLRSQIRKAEKNGLVAEVASAPGAVDAFYPILASNMKRLGSPVHSLTWFRALESAYGDRMIVGLVRSEHQVVGAGIVLLNGKRASIPWASTLVEYNHLAPNMLLYWALLSHVTDHGYRLFDFGRSTFGEGTYRFKKQWGAQPYELRWVQVLPDGRELQDTATGQPSALARRLRGWVEVLWQRLPLSVANRLGPRIRKYITL